MLRGIRMVCEVDHLGFNNEKKKNVGISFAQSEREIPAIIDTDGPGRVGFFNTFAGET